MTAKKQARDYKMPNPKTIAAMDEFSKVLNEWDRMENEVDFQDLCQKLQNELAKSYCDFENLEKDIKYFTQKNDVLEAQLEIKQKHIEYLELDLAHSKAKEEGIFRNEE